MGSEMAKNEKAFSLVEVLASVVVVSIVLIGVLNIIVFTNKVAVSNNDKLVAVYLANATIERIKEKPEDFFPLPSDASPAPEYVGRTAEDPFSYDGTHCTTEACENLYHVQINEVIYKVTVSVSQDEKEQQLRLINVVVNVKHPDKPIHSKVEGYVNL